MERYEEIERSIVTTYRHRIWANFIRAIKEYDLIKENDKIAVCISGGKDSMLMAKCFQQLHKYTNTPFDVVYVVMNPGYKDEDLQRIKDSASLLNIPITIFNTDIYKIAYQDEKNGCYLCARMRRGALYRFAASQGCNKIALGHHYDDVIETILMNMLNSGSIQTMMPKLHSDNYENMETIRPMYYVREKDIILWAKRFDLQFIKCACPKLSNCSIDDGSTSQRQFTKNLIAELKKTIPLVEKNIFKSVYNINLDMVIGYKKGNKKHLFLDDYDKEEKK